MEQFQGSAKMKKNAKQIVHELYNDISISKDPKYSDILEVLQKVYLKLEKQKYELDPGPLINRLVNYLYFTAYTNKIRFTEYQEELIRNLSEIGRTAGINGLYTLMKKGITTKKGHQGLGLSSIEEINKKNPNMFSDIKVFIVCRGNRNGRKK
ncbi:hypothetical protein EfmGK923_04670 [Enterococcus faecium]|nr:hypothetical protein EfmGK923_04670 [Enterococcus faecium]